MTKSTRCRASAGSGWPVAGLTMVDMSKEPKRAQLFVRSFSSSMRVKG